MNIECPSCHVGELSVNRPFVNGETYIIIGCSRYPECKYSVNSLKLNIKCRFCGSNLYLSGGPILTCKCLNCSKGGKGVAIPISIKTYPSLAMPDGGCIHSGDLSNCENCETSRRERKNLLEIEIPLMFSHLSQTEHSASTYSSEPKSKWRPTSYWGEDEFTSKPDDIEPDFYHYSKEPYDAEDEELNNELRGDVIKRLNEEDYWD